MSPKRYDALVIGQGYAGLTAASLAADSGLRTANFESRCMGGLILNINELDPVPEGKEHSGADLATNLLMDNMDKGVENVSADVSSVEPGEDGLWIVKTSSEAYSAPHVIVASGATLKKLGVPGEEEFYGQGVSECADCDGPMFADMETVVVGGGDSAFQEALALTDYATKVTMVIRGAGPTARPDLIERAAANPKIEQLTDSRILSISGASGQGVESVLLQTGESGPMTFPCSGVFIFIGLDPNTAFLPQDVKRDDKGALITSAHCETSLPGLWAIGAVRSGYGGMLTDAAADAQSAVSSFATSS